MDVLVWLWLGLGVRIIVRVRINIRICIGKSSESVQCAAMLKVCDACADLG